MYSTKIKEFQGKVLLSIDFGLKVIGTAKFAVGIDPFPLMHEKIIYKNEIFIMQSLKQIISDDAIDVVVVGVPFFTDGKETNQTKIVREFISKLKSENPSIDIFEQDETLTTKEAEDRMKHSPQFNFKIDVTQIDCMSAVIILEDFLNS